MSPEAAEPPPSGPGAAGELIAVGRVGPARGVKGAVFVEPWTDTPSERFAPGAGLRTATGVLEVEASTMASGRLVVQFTGVEDRPGAEALRGTDLYVVAADRPPITAADEYYDTDLIGLLARGADGTEYGPVVDVSHAAGADYLLVRTGGRDRLVPFVSAIVPTVDVTGGYVLLDPPPGLFEL